MDYQCIVVYTVINILPPKVNGATPDLSNGCITWIKNKIKRSISAYLHLFKLTPENGFFYGNLACLYYKQGFKDLAIDTYKKAIEIEPNFPDAYCNLANALKEKGLVTEAEECYNAALRLCPAHVDTLNNLGNVKREQGKIKEATECYLKALEFFPNFAPTHSNLASLFHQQGKLQQAIWHYRQAISIQPRFADAYSNMGSTLREMQDTEGALVSFKKAIELNPALSDAHCNLASIYKDMGNIEKAIESYKDALKLKPDFADAFCNLAHCYQIICNWDGYNERMQRIVKIVKEQIDENKLTSVHPHHSILYPLSNQTRMVIAIKHATIYSERISLLNNINFAYDKTKKSRLKIGYVSSDFTNHPTSHLMQSIPGFHDLSKTEIYCFALSPDDGTTFRSKIVKEAEHFIDISNIECNIEAAKLINNQGIHILINMNGYTKGARNEIFALRPAPIQVMWLGYPGTSGAPYMDYIITDQVSTPISEEKYFTEKFAFVPNTYFIGDHNQMFPHIKNKYHVRINGILYDEKVALININDNHVRLKNIQEKQNELTFDTRIPIKVLTKEIDIPQHLLDDSINPKHGKISCNNGLEVYNGYGINSTNKKIASGEETFESIIFTSRLQYGLPNNVIVFCNFNQLYKMDPKIMAIWIDILKRVPNSILWLLSFPEAGQPNIHRYAQNLDLEPERIIFSKIACKEEHVRRGQLADICLDTPLCNGHTTTMDILWAGTPVVTLPGKTLASRVAASQLTALNCRELIASTTEDYKNIAVKLATNEKYRNFIQAKIAYERSNSTLFNCELYTRGLESLYYKMWEKYLNNEVPDHITND